MKRLIATALAAMLLAIALPVLAEDAPAAKTGLTGTWVKNTKLSDDPAKIMSDRKPPEGGVGRGGSMSRGGGMGGGGMGGGGMGGGGMGGGGMGRGGGMKGGDMGGGGQPPSVEERGSKPPDMMRGFDRLEIFREGDEFDVTDAMDITLTVYTDGRKTERWTRRGQETVTATMTTEGLVVRSAAEAGEARTMIYRLDDAGHLVVTHRFQPPGAKKTISMKMVYDRTE